MLDPYFGWDSEFVSISMKVSRHAGVDSRMNYCGRSSMPTNDSSLPIVTSMQRFAHHGLRQAYNKEKEKVATYILVQWAMIGQDSMHVQHTTFNQ